MILTIVDWLGWAGLVIKPLMWLVDKMPGKKEKVPSQTLKFVLQPQGAWWHMGGKDSNPAMQIHADYYATNITSGQVFVTIAFIKKPKAETRPHVQHPTGNIFGSRYPILPGQTTELSLSFFVKPPARKEGESFKTDILVLDQYGNEHRIKNVEFPYQ